MLRDRDRLTSMLLDPRRPVQIVIAGKAHPADEGGKRLIQEIVRFTDDPRVRHRIVFLPDYDMALGHSLVQGCDVWLNNPLRPLEACGTSGMKAALNGGLNLSIRDGWWAEWFDGSNGWAIPTADGVSDPDRRDELEASALYELIEGEVAPLFYDRDEAGLPNRWLEMVKHTLVSLGPKVLATRMVQDYVTLLYQGAADSSRRLVGTPTDEAAADGTDTSAPAMTGARELADWKRRVRKAWPGVRIEHVEVVGMEDPPQVGGAMQVHATLVLPGLAPQDIQVEVAVGRVADDERLLEPVVATLAPVGDPEEVEGPLVRYAGSVPLVRSGTCGYTVRVLPAHAMLADPAEMGLVVAPRPPEAMDDGMVLR